jgi:hypothetical protein
MVSRIVLPVLNIEQGEKPLMKKVLKGAKQFTEQRINPQSSTTSSTTFSFQPPSQNTVIDRCIYLETDIVLTSSQANGLIHDQVQSGYGHFGSKASVANSSVGFATRRCSVPVFAAGTEAQVAARSLQPSGVSRPLLWASHGDLGANQTGIVDSAIGNNLAPRQFPLANAMQSLDVTINGTHFTVTPSEYIQAVMQYTTPQYRNIAFAGTAHMPDRQPQFGAGYPQNPLCLAGEGSYLGEQPRGIWLSSASQTSPTVTTFNRIREPLFISPLLEYFGHGMTNINEINVTINWCSNLFSHMFSYVPPKNHGVWEGAAASDPSELTATLPTTAQGNPPQLVLRYYTPDDGITIPAQITLPYNQKYLISHQLGEITPVDATLTGNGPNIRLNQIPAAVYVWIQKSAGERNLSNFAAHTDYKTPLTTISINFGNQSAILSNLSQAQLLDLAVDNGFDSGGTQLHPPVQSNQLTIPNSFCLKLVFGKDIPLPEGQTPGLRGDFNFQINVTYLYPTTMREVIPMGKGNDPNAHQKIGLSAGNTNPEFGRANLTLEQLFILSGKVDIRPQECTVETGIINVGDITGAEDMNGSYDSMGYEGGSFVGGSHVGGSVVGGSAVGGGFGSLVSGLAAALPGAIKAGQDAAQTAKSVRDVVDAYRSRA